MDASIRRDTESRQESLRQTGLDALGAVPWGTHFCHFYASGQELLEVLVPYFSAGLAANEFCMWITASALETVKARAALEAAVPDLETRLARHQIEILDYSQWYTRTGAFDAAAVLQNWASKLTEARRMGFEGLRLSGDCFWLETTDWQEFKHYENSVHQSIGGLRMLALCAYSLEKCGIQEILDVTANHGFVLVRNAGQWELVRSVEHPAEAALRASRERLERFAEISFEGIVISEGGRIVDCNEQFAQLLGYTIEELKGMPIGAFIAPQDYERVVEKILQGCDSDVEHTMRCKDGSLVCVEARGKNSRANPGQRYSVIRDITARKKMEDATKVATLALERERNILKSVMNGAKNAHLAFVDRDFNFVRVNETYARTCGYTPEEMVGKNHFALYPDPENEAIFARVRDTGDTVEYHDKAFVFPDHPERGVTYWDWTLFPVKDATGRVEGMVFSLLETTSRKRTEEALKESEERFRAMIHTVPSLTFEGDSAGRNTFTSESWDAYTGMNVDESRGWGWVRAMHPEDRAAATTSWAEAARSGTLLECRFRLRDRDGAYRWFICRALPTHDAEGKVVRWTGSLTDIDDLVQAQQTLRHADRRKDDFLAMLAPRIAQPPGSHPQCRLRHRRTRAGRCQNQVGA